MQTVAEDTTMYRFIYIVFLFVFLTVPFIFAQKIFAQENRAEEKSAENTAKPEPQKNPFFLNIVQPERSILRRYDQATRLIDAARDAEAAQLLGSILESSADSFVVPLKKENEEFPQTTDRTFFDTVLEKLQGLSAKGKESYSLQFETQAKRLLENAVKNNSFDEILRIAKNYFPTPSGGLATAMVGLEQCRRGNWDAAVKTFRRLETVKPRSAEELRQYEPALSLSHITCLLQTGRKEEAEKVAERFLRNFPEPEIALSGEELWKPKNADEIIGRINTSIQRTAAISTTDWLERIGWLLPAGISAQNPETAADVPLLDFIWSVPSLGTSSSTVIDQILRNVASAGETYIPASQPLLIQDTLIVRGIGDVAAVDAKTGKRLWYAEEQAPIFPPGIQSQNFRQNFRPNVFFQDSYQQTQQMFSRFVIVIRMFFWHDRAMNQMSSDGTKVFFVEGLDPMVQPNFGGNIRQQKIHVGNNRFAEDPLSKQGNTLTARDVKTGKITWQAGKFPYVQKVLNELGKQRDEIQRQENAKRNQQKTEQNQQAEREQQDTDNMENAVNADDIFMSEINFLGAPLPLQGKLYCIAERDSIVRVLVLDAQNGKLLSQLPLQQASVPIESEAHRRYYGLIPSAKGGIIYCPTGAGTLAAVDAVSLSPLWLFSYVKPVQEEERRGGNRQNQFFNIARNGNNDEFKRLFEKAGWQVPCLIADANRLLFAPPDNTGLYCLDSSTGKLLWKNEEFNRSNALFLACIRNEVCFIVAPQGIIPVSMKDGTRLGSTNKPLSADSKVEVGIQLPQNLRPAGTGVYDGSRYYLPLSEGFLGIIDFDNRDVRLISCRNLHAVSENAKNSEPQKTEEKTEATEEPQDFMPPNEMSVLPNRHGIAGRASSLVMDTAKEAQLGNLIGLRGRFFSYSPNAVYGFDQWNVLKAVTEKRLKDNPDDIEGLILSGRIKRAEGNIETAAADFRRAYQLSKSSDKLSLPAADGLRNTLLQAIQTDYNKWKSSAAELESLTEFPEELAAVLFSRAAGAFKEGGSDAFIDVLKKVICLELDHSVQVKTEPELSSELHRVLGLMMTQKPAANAENFANDLQRFSEMLFQQLKERKDPKEYLPNLERVNSEHQRVPLILTRPWREQDTPAYSGEIHRWKLFANIFRSKPVAEKADAALQELYRQNKLFTALDLLESKPVFRILPEASPDKKVPLPETENITEDEKTKKAEAAKKMLPPPSLQYKPKNAKDEKYDAEVFRWNTENPVFRDSADTTAETNQDENVRNSAARRILAQLKSQGGRQAGNQATVPFIGGYAQFLAPYSYTMEISYRNTPALICMNQFGEERWRLDLSAAVPDYIDYGFFADNMNHYKQGLNSQQVYLKGCGHLLILVQGNVVLAIDTYNADTETSPKVLWTKRMIMHQSAKEMYTSRQLGNVYGWFTDSSVFVSNKVICCIETDRVFGFDPMTGRMMWCRELTHQTCSLLGEGENLFIYYPNSHTAVALSPETGHILTSGKVPSPVFWAYGTHLIFMKDEWKQNRRRFQINTADLRDLFSPQTSADGTSLPVRCIWSDVSDNSQIRPVLDGQVLALLSWDKKTLHMFDMLNQRELLGLLDNNGRRTGAELPLSKFKTVESWDCDLDVKLVNGKYLVMFTDKRNVDTQQKQMDEDGVKFRRNINVVQNTPSRMVGSATLMLFEPDGKRCWQKPVPIDDWFMLQNVPEGSPLLLFAYSITDHVINNKPQEPPYYSTGIMGIDKTTGEMSFRKLIPSKQGSDNTILRSLRVSLSPDKKEISFIAPNRTVSAVFEKKP